MYLAETGKLGRKNESDREEQGPKTRQEEEGNMDENLFMKFIALYANTLKSQERTN